MKILEATADSDVEKAAPALYAACENVRNLALFIRRADDAPHQDKLNEISSRLGYDGEFIINKTAIANGLYFFPKYLNESLEDYSENVRDTRKMRANDFRLYNAVGPTGQATGSLRTN